MANNKMNNRTNYKKSKYHIGICELHNEIIHGFNDSSSSNIKGHYMLMEKFSTYQKYMNYNSSNHDIESDSESIEDDESDNYDSTNLIDLYRYKYNILLHSRQFINKSHEFIRNYHNIIKSVNYIQPHIVECVYLSEPGGECIAILKTFWLKIIQRTWKRVYKQKMAIFKSIPFLRLREIGLQHTIYTPNIRGMLCDMYYKNNGI